MRLVSSSQGASELLSLLCRSLIVVKAILRSSRVIYCDNQCVKSVPALAPPTRCLKITEKVSFNIASEASYTYILSGQKFIENAKNGPFWGVFENLKVAVKQCYQTGQF